MIRGYRDGDDAEWLRMRRALWGDCPDDQQGREMGEILAGDSEEVFFAERPGGGLCGFVEAALRSRADGCDSTPVGYIEGWYVDEDVRRRGAGRALVEAAEEWARSRGCRQMASDAELENDVSHRAHERLGYEETARLVLFKKGLKSWRRPDGGRGVVGYNRWAWDRQAERGNRWAVPVGPEEVARARRGDWRVVLTPTKPVPADWFPPLAGLDVLCLAGGGGQQGPVLAAAGARVTVFDNSPNQLALDRMVAEREGLGIGTVLGDMAHLSAFPGARFDLIVHPVSNVFVPDVRPVWREAFRVLRPGGSLLAGFMNPVQYLFDDIALERGELRVIHRIPYSDLRSPAGEDRARPVEEGKPLEFGHTLGDQIGGQLAAGFLLAGFYEDIDPESVLGDFIPSYIATRALRPGS